MTDNESQSAGPASLHCLRVSPSCISDVREVEIYVASTWAKCGVPRTARTPTFGLTPTRKLSHNKKTTTTSADDEGVLQRQQNLCSFPPHLFNGGKLYSISWRRVCSHASRVKMNSWKVSLAGVVGMWLLPRQGAWRICQAVFVSMVVTGYQVSGRTSVVWVYSKRNRLCQRLG